MTDEAELSTLLLPGERVLWQGAPRLRPRGPAYFEAAIGCGCLGLVALGLLAAMLATLSLLVKRGITEDVLVMQIAETVGLLLVLFGSHNMYRGLRKDLRNRTAYKRVRFVVTDRRVIRRGEDVTDEQIVELTELAETQRVCRPNGRELALIDESGEVAIRFEAIEPSEAALVERAIATARGEPTSPLPPSPA
jgi:hypothetical protein